MLAVLEIAQLPQNSLDASAAFMQTHLAEAAELLKKPETDALAIVLPTAGSDHDDWRRSAARDLARAYAPQRVNIIGASTAEKVAPLLAYLRDAPGVTGQYLAAHE